MPTKPRADLTPMTVAYETTPLIKPTGFREYDARWIFGPELNLLGVRALGLGLGTYFAERGERPVVVGHEPETSRLGFPAISDVFRESRSI